MYGIELKQRARQDLDKIRGPQFQRIRDVIMGLRNDPTSVEGLEILPGHNNYRLMNANTAPYKILLSIDEPEQIITILRVKSSPTTPSSITGAFRDIIAKVTGDEEVVIDGSEQPKTVIIPVDKWNELQEEIAQLQEEVARLEKDLALLKGSGSE